LHCAQLEDPDAMEMGWHIKSEQKEKKREKKRKEE
jgi:hypothetical protein